MERRDFLKSLCVGSAAALAASPARAFTPLASSAPASLDPSQAPQASVATPEDLEQAKIEQTFGGGYWRHRRRRARRYGQEEYGR
jgi:hypothetical protein